MERPEIQPFQQFLNTEHFTLQGARTAATTEANGRASSFLTTVSGAMVALGFVAQATRLDRSFLLFGVCLFFPLTCLGVTSFVRSVQVGVEDFIYVRGMNRIRRYFTELRDHIILGTADDYPTTLRGVGAVAWPHGFQMALTSGSLLALVTGVLGAVFAGLLAALVGAGPAACYAAGGATFAVLVVTLFRLQRVVWRKVERAYPARFPAMRPEA